MGVAVIIRNRGSRRITYLRSGINCGFSFEHVEFKVCVRLSVGRGN